MSYLIEARNSARDVWAFPDFPGQPDLGPFYLPTVGHGKVDVRDYVADGLSEGLGFIPKFRQANRGTRVGDLLWTGLPIKLASGRFIGILDSIDATGYQTSPALAVDGVGDSLGEFVVLVVKGEPSSGADLRRIGEGQSFRFAVSDRLVHALISAGVEHFERRPA